MIRMATLNGNKNKTSSSSSSSKRKLTPEEINRIKKSRFKSPTKDNNNPDNFIDVLGNASSFEDSSGKDLSGSKDSWSFIDDSDIKKLTLEEQELKERNIDSRRADKPSLFKSIDSNEIEQVKTLLRSKGMESISYNGTSVIDYAAKVFLDNRGYGPGIINLLQQKGAKIDQSLFKPKELVRLRNAIDIDDGKVDNTILGLEKLLAKKKSEQQIKEYMFKLIIAGKYVSFRAEYNIIVADNLVKDIPKFLTLTYKSKNFLRTIIENRNKTKKENAELAKYILDINRHSSKDKSLLLAAVKSDNNTILDLIFRTRLYLPDNEQVKHPAQEKAAFREALRKPKPNALEISYFLDNTRNLDHTYTLFKTFGKRYNQLEGNYNRAENVYFKKYLRFAKKDFKEYYDKGYSFSYHGEISPPNYDGRYVIDMNVSKLDPVTTTKIFTTSSSSNERKQKSPPRKTSTPKKDLYPSRRKRNTSTPSGNRRFIVDMSETSDLSPIKEMNKLNLDERKQKSPSERKNLLINRKPKPLSINLVTSSDDDDESFSSFENAQRDSFGNQSSNSSGGSLGIFASSSDNEEEELNPFLMH